MKHSTPWPVVPGMMTSVIWWGIPHSPLIPSPTAWWAPRLSRWGPIPRDVEIFGPNGWSTHATGRNTTGSPPFHRGRPSWRWLAIKPNGQPFKKINYKSNEIKKSLPFPSDWPWTLCFSQTHEALNSLRVLSSLRRLSSLSYELDRLLFDRLFRSIFLSLRLRFKRLFSFFLEKRNKQHKNWKTINKSPLSPIPTRRLRGNRRGGRRWSGSGSLWSLF